MSIRFIVVLAVERIPETAQFTFPRYKFIEDPKKWSPGYTCPYIYEEVYRVDRPVDPMCHALIDRQEKVIYNLTEIDHTVWDNGEPVGLNFELEDKDEGN
jgi:hypothetical protein